MKLPFVAAFVLGLGVAIACGSDEECSPGGEACPCVSGTCLTGLVCLSGYCVDPNWTPPGGTSVASTASGEESGDGFDNVEACNELVDAFDCGMVDLGMLIDCGLYANLACDISDYFECVSNDVDCVDGNIDPTQLADCAALAQCG